MALDFVRMPAFHFLTFGTIHMGQLIDCMTWFCAGKNILLFVDYKVILYLNMYFIVQNSNLIEIRFYGDTKIYRQHKRT